MRFQLFCFSSAIALASLINTQSYAMITDKEEENEERSSTLLSPTLSPDALEEKKLPKIKDLRGFQPHYKTATTAEEWAESQQLLTAAVQVVSTCPAISQYLTGFLDTCPEYFHLYRNLFENPNKAIKKLDEKKLLTPLFNYAANLEYLLDNIRIDYRKTGKDYDTLQSKILPVIQPTFNQYIKAYEMLTGKVTSSLGSLNFAKIFFTSNLHLFYKRDEEGFLIFTIDPLHSAPIDTNLLDTYIPYKNKGNDFFEHYILFHIDQKSGRPTIEKRSGLIFRKAPSIHEQNIKHITITPYYGEDAVLNPYSREMTISLQKTTLNPIFPQVTIPPSQEEIVSKVAEEMPIVDPINNIAMVDLVNSEKLQSSLPSVTLSGFYSFGMKLLGERTSCFLPYLSGAIEELEAEYLFISKFKEKAAKAELTQPEDILLLEYIKESFPNQTPEEVMADYERALLEAYEDEEVRTYKEKIRREQEERSQKVAKGEHYNAKGKKGKKNKDLNRNKVKKPKEQESLALSSCEEEQMRIEAGSKAAKRLNLLKNEASSRKKPEKFRKFLQAVNVATQELARLNVPVGAKLNKSSHGNIVVEGEKPITLVRPHGLRGSISKKNAKGILTGLLNSYFETLSKSKG